jgi:Skp family chaperone for outer membrane proteins
MVLVILLQDIANGDVRLPIWAVVISYLLAAVGLFWSKLSPLFLKKDEHKTTIELKRLDLEDKLDEKDRQILRDELNRLKGELDKYKELYKKQTELLNEERKLRNEQEKTLRSISTGFEIMYRSLKTKLPEDAEILLFLKNIVDGGFNK